MVGIDAADGAGGVEADAEGRREEADSHGEDDDHRVMHLVNAERAGDRKEQRPEQHDRRNAFEDRPEHDKGDDRHRHEAGGAARQLRHRRRQIA
jgi:hypothetical protein